VCSRKGCRVPGGSQRDESGSGGCRRDVRARCGGHGETLGGSRCRGRAARGAGHAKAPGGERGRGRAAHEVRHAKAPFWDGGGGRRGEDLAGEGLESDQHQELLGVQGSARMAGEGYDVQLCGVRDGQNVTRGRALVQLHSESQGQEEVCFKIKVLESTILDFVEHRLSKGGSKICRQHAGSDAAWSQP
jgi:hypothetical protein